MPTKKENDAAIAREVENRNKPIHTKTSKKQLRPKRGDRLHIPVALLEFNVEGKTLWVQAPETGATLLRIQFTGKIHVDVGCQNPVSHCDIRVQGDAHFCLSEDATLG